MKILFCGDICPADVNTEKLLVEPALEALIASSDLNVGTLECPITESNSPKPFQSINLKSPPKTSLIFKLFHAFSLANNHILDYGEEGAEDTQAFLRKNGNHFFGYGENDCSATEPFTFRKNNVSIALFGITQWYNATKTSSGTCSDRSKQLYKKIRNYRREGYFVAVLPHWNYEYTDYPSPASKSLAKKLIKAGANLILGSHPHVVQGFEKHKNSKIFYSLGNFIFSKKNLFAPSTQDDRPQRTFILECNISENAHDIQTKIHYVRTSEKCIRLMSASESQHMEDYLENISLPLRSRKELSKAFYSCAPMIYRKVASTLSSMAKRQGIWTVVSRLHRIRLQDILIRYYALKNRKHMMIK